MRFEMPDIASVLATAGFVLGASVVLATLLK